ncbi:MAG: hypothetical protein ACLGHN_12705 [Bacteriovoracia bacterium]
MKTLLLLFFILLISPAKAVLDFEDHSFPEFVTSARALALGNAYLNKVDDSWSAFYNPAGLGTVRKPQFHILNGHIEASSGLMDVIGDGPASEVPGKFVDSFDVEDFRTELAQHQGKLAHSRFNLFPNITVRGLTLGYFYSQRNRAIINDDVANNFEVAERRDQGPVMSLTASLFGGILKVGATGLYLNRKQLYKSFGPTEPTVISDADYKKGSSFQLIAGTRLTLPWTLLPTFSAVLRNATDSDFDGEALQTPEPIEQTLDVGFSLTPQIGKRTRIHLEANYKDVGNAYETNTKRRFAAGAELDFNRRLFFRAGWGDGWGSGGLGVRTRTFILDLTTYAVDRARNGFREEEDRRWVISLSSGF